MLQRTFHTNLTTTEHARDASRILVVLHQERSTPGRVGRILREIGYELDIRRPALGDPLPDPRSTDHLAAVVFGGPMSANDTDDFITEETRFVGRALETDFPVLGICLGAQLMAKALGCRVFGHPDGWVEIGYYDIEPTPAGRDLIWWPEKMYQWHREGFDLPRDVTLLASTQHYPNQAFAIGSNSFGLQFHFELTLAMLHRWTVHGRERLTLPGAKQRYEHFAERLVFDPAHIQWATDFLMQWTAKLRIKGHI